MQLIEFNSEQWLNIDDLPNEHWYPVPGFDNAYMFSDYGRIKTFKRKGNSKTRIKKCRIDNTGYVYTNIQYNGVHKTIKPHRLIALYLIPNPNNKEFVNHMDLDKLNNHISNLEWVTPSENAIHYHCNTTKPTWNKGKRGSETKLNKHIIQLTKDGEFIKEWDCIKTAANYYNISDTHLINVCKGVKRTGVGFIWKYANKKEGDSIG